MKNIACVLAAILALHSPYIAAQSSCSSDGMARPLALFERFISADCEACWADASAPAPGPTAVVLDWIVPGSLDEDAPLSAAATRDALARLQSLGRTAFSGTDIHTAPVNEAKSAKLRVVNGPPLNDYLGTSIAFTSGRRLNNAASSNTWTYYLVLIETIAQGSDGTSVNRNIVRNMLQGSWHERSALSKNKNQWLETRPMRIPDGAQADHLRMVGWVQDAEGRIVVAAQSDCRSSQ